MARRVEAHPHVVLWLVLREGRSALQGVRRGPGEIGDAHLRCSCIGARPGSVGQTGGWYCSSYSKEMPTLSGPRRSTHFPSSTTTSQSSRRA